MGVGMKIMTKEIEKLLVERKNILDQLAEIKQGYEDMKKRILTPKLLAKVEAIESECKSTSEGAEVNLSELESKIKDGVIALGTSVKAEGYGHAVFVNGRKSWDTKSLEKRMKEEQYKWLENYLTVGEPSCTIRKA